MKWEKKGEKRSHNVFMSFCWDSSSFFSQKICNSRCHEWAKPAVRPAEAQTIQPSVKWCGQLDYFMGYIKFI